MVQARRKAPVKKKTRSRNSGQGLFGVGMLLAGMVIGSLVTILWQGTKSADGGVGTGIRQMIETSRQQSEVEQQDQQQNVDEQPKKQSTNYDFFTVLPEIEVVVTTAEQPAAKPAGDSDNKVESESKPVTDTSAYMLQAGSYQSQSDADRLKANLALQGLVSAIQKVTIQGRGDFYRVRLGPYTSHAQMVKADEQLVRAGIKALRLKISKPG